MQNPNEKLEKGGERVRNKRRHKQWKCFSVIGFALILSAQLAYAPTVRTDTEPGRPIHLTLVSSVPETMVFNPIQSKISEAGEGKSVPSHTAYYKESDVVMLAKLLYRECRGVASDTQKACVVWTALNRVDSEDFPEDTIEKVLTSPSQFAYSPNTPVEDHLYALALDVLERWNMEKNGELDVGRVLPSDYTFFSGDGTFNYFRNEYQGGTIWDYSLASPYES